MSDFHGMLERVTVGCKGIDAFLLCHKALSSRVELSVKQAAQLCSLAINGTADLRAFTLCNTQMETSNAKQVANMPKFEDVLCNKLGLSDSTMNYVCTSSNPEGKHDLGALLKFFATLACVTGGRRQALPIQ
jgi:hypothetical protein